LSESPTLFIGYSGKNDAFLPQIEEQFDDQHRLFWVDMGGQAPDHLQRKLLSSRLAHYMSCENGSDLFLIQLARELGCFPPTIFADPYQHLLDELDEIASYPILKEELSENKKENLSVRSNTSTQDILLGTKNKLKEVQQQDKEAETDFLQKYLQGSYEEIIEKLETQQSLIHEQSLWLARAYFSLALREPNKLKEFNLYEKLIERFKENTELDIQEQVAEAMFNKGIVLGTLEQPESAIKVYDELIAKFGTRNELVLQAQVAKALFNKGIALGTLEQLENEIEVYDELITKFGDSNELVLQKIVAAALFNKGVILGDLSQPENTIEVSNELIAKFGTRDEPSLQELVARAFNAMGYSRLLMAKQHWKNSDVAQSYLYQAKEDFSQALIKSPESDYSLILGNMAYTEFLQGDIAESERHLHKALKQGEQSLYDDTVKDIAKHPIELDNDFRNLLEKVWHEIKE